MAEEVDLDLLRNCTILTVNKFPWTTTLNETAVIGVMNLTDVIDLISNMIDFYSEKYLEDDSIKYVSEINCHPRSICGCGDRESESEIERGIIQE